MLKVHETPYANSMRKSWHHIHNRKTRNPVFKHFFSKRLDPVE